MTKERKPTFDVVTNVPNIKFKLIRGTKQRNLHVVSE